MQIPKPDLHRVRMVQKQQNPTSSEKSRSPHMTAAGKKNRVVYRSRATNRLRNTPEERVTQNKQTFEVSEDFCMLQLLLSELKKIYRLFFNGSAQNLSFCMLQLLSELKKIYRLFSTVLLRISHSACYSFCQS